MGEAHAKGFQLTAHAQGDGVIDMLLSRYESALAKEPITRIRDLKVVLTMVDGEVLYDAQLLDLAGVTCECLS
jgi:predicted amidohydrolase YtcJ